jgi:hypothetical protein
MSPIRMVGSVEQVGGQGYFDRVCDTDVQADLSNNYQLPPICSWWTSSVSPSCMSSCLCVSVGRAVFVCSAPR